MVPGIEFEARVFAFDVGQCRKEASRIGVAGPGQDLLRRALLDDDARVHHGDALRDGGDRADVVADHDDRQAEARHEVPQKIEHLRLDRDVERRRRLVGDEELGLARERHRDQDALAHPARKLMRVARLHPLRIPDLHLFEQLPAAAAELSARGRRPAQRPGMGNEHVRELPPDREERVQVGHRILEDHGDLHAADPAPFRLAQIVERRGIEHHPAARAPCLLRPDAEDRAGQHRLSAPALADDAERLACGKGEIDAVEHLQRAVEGRNVEVVVLDTEKGGAHRLRLRGSRMSRRPSPRRLKPSTVRKMARPGKAEYHHQSGI